ncbi:MAG: hypothetical protein AAFZ92_08110 [Pseudomonadota bacterium]
MSFHTIANTHMPRANVNNDSIPPNKRLANALQQLSTQERRIMWVFAVVFEGINQSNMKSLLSLLDWKNEQGKKLSGMMEKTLREKLLRKKLLVKIQGKLACAIELTEVLAREACREGVFGAIVIAASTVVPCQRQDYYFRYSFYRDRASLRGIREALYFGDQQRFTELARLPSGRRHEVYAVNTACIAALAELCMQPFDADWFATVPATMQYLILSHIARGPTHFSVYRYLCARWDQRQLSQPDLRRLLLVWRIHNGVLAQFEEIMPTDKHWQNDVLRGSYLCLQGDYTGAIPVFENAQKGLRKFYGKNTLVLGGMPGIWFLLGLLIEPKHHKHLLTKQGNAVCKADDTNVDINQLLSVFKELLDGLKTNSDLHTFYKENCYSHTEESLLLYSFICHWLDERPELDLLTALANAAVNAQARGDAWFLYQSLTLLQHYVVDGDQGKLFADKIEGKNAIAIKEMLKKDLSQSDIESILGLFKPQAPWERALNALENIHENSGPSAPHDEQTTRLVWFIDNSYGQYSLQAKEQKLGKQGRWSKGRVVSLKRLHEESNTLNCLSEQVTD